LGKGRNILNIGRYTCCAPDAAFDIDATIFVLIGVFRDALQQPLNSSPHPYIIHFHPIPLLYHIIHIVHPPSLPSFHPTSYLTLGHTGLPLAANATHPPIRHNPPSGVTGPKNLNRCGSSTSRYIEPENMVMPAVKSPIASVFCGATTAAKVRTVEWMSYDGVSMCARSVCIENSVEKDMSVRNH